MNTPRLFSPGVTADLDTIGAAIAISSAVMDAAALTVLAGVIGQRVFVSGANGKLTPLSLLTAVLVPPVAESRSLVQLLTAPLEAAQQATFESSADTPEAHGREDSRPEMVNTNAPSIPNGPDTPDSLTKPTRGDGGHRAVLDRLFCGDV